MPHCKARLCGLAIPVTEPKATHESAVLHIREVVGAEPGHSEGHLARELLVRSSRPTSAVRWERSQTSGSPQPDRPNDVFVAIGGLADDPAEVLGGASRSASELVDQHAELFRPARVVHVDRLQPERRFV